MNLFDLPEAAPLGKGFSNPAPGPLIPLPRDGIELTLLEFIAQYSVLACGTCSEWALQGYQTGSQNAVLGRRN